MLQTYAKFAPTGFDARGLNSHRMGEDDDSPNSDRATWFVAPCSIDRDSGALDRSNWEQQNKILAEAGEEGKDWETHRFGHWANGWFEIVLCRPETNAAGAAEEIARKLYDYPVIDDMHLSELESEAEADDWRFYGSRDFLTAVRRQYLELAEEEADAFENLDHEQLYELFRKVNGQDRSHYEGNGWCFDRTAAERVTEEVLRDFLKTVAKE